MIPWASLGFTEVREAASAEAALRVTEETRVDLIITDLCVFAVENGWASIQYGAKTGYCAAGYLTFSDTYPGKTSQTGRSAMVRTATALRATPSTAAATFDRRFTPNPP